MPEWPPVMNTVVMKVLSLSWLMSSAVRAEAGSCWEQWVM
jgi:hypothetical protein